METTFNQAAVASYTEKPKISLLKKFMSWCEDQQTNRLLWLGVALTAHGCIITPITIMAVLFAGNSLFLFILALIAMGASLVTNLSAMPTKITIPVFILSTLIDIAIIFLCMFSGLDIAKTYI